MICATAAITVVMPRAAAGQGTTVVMGGRLSDWTAASVGSEEENYLRVLQVAGIARQRPWSVRPFGPGELRGLVTSGVSHPWAARITADTQRATPLRARFASLGGSAGIAVNTTTPFSMNDGAIWTGRGPTAYARYGAMADWQPATWATLSVRAEPMAFWASNLRVGIVPNGAPGALRFGDALEPTVIDEPQRFGTRPYARFDPGQSTVRLDVLGAAIGFSTANQWWGPTLIDPQILGDNASGFPHLFVGTSRPTNIGFGTLHFRLEAGRLAQSAYSPMPADSAYRSAAGGTAVLTINGVPGLEIGGSRFFHDRWDGASSALSRIKEPLGQFFGSSYTVQNSNQLASVFGRWVLAPAHVEVWGEYMRNDAAANSRDLVVEPDHDAGFTVGTRRVWQRRDGAIAALRVEWLNDQITHLDRVRVQVRPYQHFPIRQGHTEVGQVLGSAGAQGGSSTTIGYDRYLRDGRWTVEAARRVVQSSLAEGSPERQWDVLYYMRAERLRFGKHADLFTGVSLMPELNRNFGGDVVNLRLDAGYRF